MRCTAALAAVLLPLALASARAQDEQPDAQPGGEPTIAELSQQIEAQIHPTTGKVSVGAMAQIDLPSGYRFLGAQDARFMVEKVWGNPQRPDVIGMVLPTDEPIAATWGIVFTYDDAGYVKDDDAASTNFTEILQSLKDGCKESNVERKRQHFPTIDVLGWAEPPHYDAAARKLYWCKRLQFEGSPSPTLNYDVRILGRTGYLVLTAVADDAGQNLATLRVACQDVLGKTEFVAGKRYADYKPGVDKEAAYGIGGLVLGGVVAAKLLKGGILVKLFKPILIGLVALAAGAKKLFAGKSTA